MELAAEMKMKLGSLIKRKDSASANPYCWYIIIIQISHGEITFYHLRNKILYMHFKLITFIEWKKNVLNYSKKCFINFNVVTVYNI